MSNFGLNIINFRFRDTHSNHIMKGGRKYHICIVHS